MSPGAKFKLYNEGDWILFCARRIVVSRINQNITNAAAKGGELWAVLGIQAWKGVLAVNNAIPAAVIRSKTVLISSPAENGVTALLKFCESARTAKAMDWNITNIFTPLCIGIPGGINMTMKNNIVRKFMKTVIGRDWKPIAVVARAAAASPTG
jgi:hypothetical protein